MFDRAVAFRNVLDTLTIAMDHDGSHAALILADERSELARLLLEAYREGLPGARVVLFDEAFLDVTREALDAVGPKDLVVLIQSTVFKIPDLRIRVELFRREVKVIEHSNLSRMEGVEIEHFFDALAYDPAYYRTVGHALKANMDVALSAVIESDGESLRFDSPLEVSKVNIGHFEGLKNFGSQFPIGEVFTEARDLERVSGRTKIYAFTDTRMRLNVPDRPITLVVERGRVVEAIDSTTDFDLVLAAIRRDEGDVWIRELGFGMNRGFSRERRVTDVAAFERVCGVHLSLGARHGVYKKPQFNHRETRYHVDSFVVTDRVLLDERVVFENGEWRVSSVLARALTSYCSRGGEPMQTRDYLERMIRRIAEALASAAGASAAGRYDEAEKVLEGAFSGVLGIPKRDLARLDDTTLLALLGPGKLAHVASLLEAEADIAEAKGELLRAEKLRHRVRSLRGRISGP